MVKEKYLCIQLRRIGDVIMTTPAIRALAKAKPNAEIHFLTELPAQQVLQYNPYLKKIIIFPTSPNLKETINFIRELRAEQYSTVIDFYGLNKTAVLSWLTGARCRVGFNFKGRSFFYTDHSQIPGELTYSAVDKLALLNAFGIQSKNYRLDFPIDEKDEAQGKQILKKLNLDRNKRLISISPVSRRDYKVWPTEKFAEICDYLIERYNSQIIFLWGPNEQHFVDEVRDKMHHTALPNYPIPTLRETVALLQHVDLHIGNDNGPAHFAISAGIPTIIIFGRPFPQSWTPPDNDSKHMYVDYNLDCKKSCQYPNCDRQCIIDLPSDRVIKKIDSFFR